MYFSIGGLLVVTCCATVPQLGAPAPPASSAPAPAPTVSVPPAPVCVYNVPAETRGPRAFVAPRIVGGKPAIPGAWPGAVAIATDGRPYCTGSLIRPNVVLTAAHCQVRAGDTVLADSTSLEASTKLTVTSSKLHPQYDHYTNDYDVALAVLHAPASSAPVALAENLFGDADMPDAMVVGWGTTKEGGGMVNGLREVNVPRWQWGDCKTAYSTLTSRQTCAGAHGRDSCQGDSGGPLFGYIAGHWEQIGITSFGRGCALEGYPGVYTDVAAPEIKSWIETCAGT